MSEYTLSNSAAVIDSAITRVASADTTPTDASQNMVTSGGVKSYVDGEVGDFSGKTVTTSSTGLDSTDNDTSIPTSAAVIAGISNVLRVASYGRSATWHATSASQVIPITELWDPHNIGTVSNGTVTLGAGTYLVEYSGEFDDSEIEATDVFQVRLRHNGSAIINDRIGGSANASYYNSGNYVRRSSGLIAMGSTETQTVDIYTVYDGLNAKAKNVFLTIIKVKDS